MAMYDNVIMISMKKKTQTRKEKERKKI